MNLLDRRAWLLWSSLALACGDDGPSDTGGSSGPTTAGPATEDPTAADTTAAGSSGESGSPTTADSTGDPTNTSAPTSGPTGESSTGGEPDGGSLGMGHGVVHLELRRGLSQAEDPFVGTARIEVTLLHLECLRDFYDANPDWTSSGPLGGPVFDAAASMGLCEPEAGGIACTVDDITQTVGAAAGLTVVYDVQPPIEDGTLRFGPLPTDELAGCVPVVRVTSGAAVQGLDAMGNTIWGVESFMPPEAATDQQAPIVIRAARL
ncbi:MAG: hypothetical protein KDK70_39205 [Myxococcales bacterium]|nr:hypothetical protein [Myxococcales bacterium]